MSSTTPLLSSIDDTIESCLSGPRITHLLPSLVVAFAWAFISVFTDVEPTWRCLDPNDKISASSSSPCNLDKDSWKWDSKTSVVSEWNLQCSAPTLFSLPASAFFIGCLIGGLLLSTLADSILGRKRWLLVRGHKEEAVRTLKNIAALSGNLINSSFSKLHFCDETTTCSTDVLSNMRMLWERKWARRRLTAIMTACLGVGLVYYGMPLNVGNLSSNLYLSMTFNALAEFPSSLVTFFLVGRINRRSSLLTFTTISGICSLFCVLDNTFVPERVQMIFEVISFFSTCTSFNIVMIYTIELFPTCVRNSALALVRQALVLGSVLAPVLVVEGRKKKFLSFGVFGLIIICCCLFAVCLPETKERSMCDTMEEEEYKEVNQSSNGPQQLVT